MFIEPESEKSHRSSGGAKYALLETKYFAPAELQSSPVSRFYKHFVRAPSKAGCFLLGESPSRVKSNQLLVPSVAAVRRRSQDRTKRLKRTQGITQAVRETAVPEA